MRKSDLRGTSREPFGGIKTLLESVLRKPIPRRVDLDEVSCVVPVQEWLPVVHAPRQISPTARGAIVLGDLVCAA